MPIFLLNVQQIQLNVSLWTQEHLRAAVVTLADAVLSHLNHKPRHSFSDVHQIALAELMTGVFLLGYGFLQREVVVVCIGVHDIVFDAQLYVCVRW
jgi:hypothetical protein